MKYQSAEWHEVVKEASLTNKRYKADCMAWTARWQNLILNCPGGIDKLTDWETRNGKVVSIKIVAEKPSPSDLGKTPIDLRKYLARFTGDYECFVKLHKGIWSAMVAIGSGEYVIDGDIMEVMKKIVSVDALIDLTQTIPATYD